MWAKSRKVSSLPSKILTLGMIVLGASACDGTIGSPLDSARSEAEPSLGPNDPSPSQPGPGHNDPSDTGAISPGNPVTPGTPTTPGDPDPNPTTDPDPDPTPTETVITPFTSASFGEHCSGGALGRWLVLSGAGSSCDVHAASLDAPSASTPYAIAQLPASVTAPSTLSLDATVCLSAGACAARTLELELTSYSEGSGFSGSFVIHLDGERAEGSLNGSWCEYDAGSTAGLVGNLAVDEVSIYQAVKIPIVRNGQAVSNRNGPIVEDREALVRVFVEPGAGWTNQDVIGRLVLDSLATGPVVYEDQRAISRASDETLPESTLNFLIPAQVLKSDTSFTVSLHSTAVCSASAGSAGARFPAQGSANLAVASPNGDLEVVLVPIRYNADGSGRLPDTSQAQLDRYRDHIYSLFPVSGVTISVRQPVDWDSQTSANGSGWGDLLNEVLNVRANDRPADHVYYYGIFSPAGSFQNFCNGGCVAGLGPVPRAGDVYARGAIGLGFAGDSAAETAAHELGHALGRQHSPCGGASGADPGYPYNGGGIGVWGFDVNNNRLLSPTQNADFMGYCNPAWISDYSFGGIFDRIQTVNQGRGVAASGLVVRWRVAISDLDGLRWGRPVELLHAPLGETIDAMATDASGLVLQPIQVTRYALGELDGGFYMIPDLLPVGTSEIRIPGAGTLAVR